MELTDIITLDTAAVPPDLYSAIEPSAIPSVDIIDLDTSACPKADPAPDDSDLADDIVDLPDSFAVVSDPLPAPIFSTNVNSDSALYEVIDMPDTCFVMPDFIPKATTHGFTSDDLAVLEYFDVVSPPLITITTTTTAPPTPNSDSTSSDELLTSELVSLYARSARRQTTTSPAYPPEFNIAAAVEKVLPLVEDYAANVWDRNVAFNLQRYLRKYSCSVLSTWALARIIPYDICLAAVYHTDYGRVLFAALAIFAGIMHYLYTQCSDTLDVTVCDDHPLFLHIDANYCRCLQSHIGPMQFCWLDNVLTFADCFKFFTTTTGTFCLSNFATSDNHATPATLNAGYPRTLDAIVLDSDRGPQRLSALFPPAFIAKMQSITRRSMPRLLMTLQHEVRQLQACIATLRADTAQTAAAVDTDTRKPAGKGPSSYKITPATCVIPVDKPVSRAEKNCVYCRKQYKRDAGYHGICDICNISCCISLSKNKRIRAALAAFDDRSSSAYQQFCKTFFGDAYKQDQEPYTFFKTPGRTILKSESLSDRKVIQIRPLMQCRVCGGASFCVDCILQCKVPPKYVYAFVSTHRDLTLRFPDIVCSQTCYRTLVDRNSNVNNRHGVESRFDKHYAGRKAVGLIAASHNRQMCTMLSELPTVPVPVYKAPTKAQTPSGAATATCQ